MNQEEVVKSTAVMLGLGRSLDTWQVQQKKRPSLCSNYCCQPLHVSNHTTTVDEKLLTLLWQLHLFQSSETESHSKVLNLRRDSFWLWPF